LQNLKVATPAWLAVKKCFALVHREDQAAENFFLSCWQTSKRKPCTT